MRTFAQPVCHITGKDVVWAMLPFIVLFFKSVPDITKERIKEINQITSYLEVYLSL